MKVAVLTDSAANLNKAFIDAHKNLFVVPLMISVDGKEYHDQVEISTSEFYENQTLINIRYNAENDFVYEYQNQLDNEYFLYYKMAY